MDESRPQDPALLSALRRTQAERERLPPAERPPIGHPEKYAHPLGMDDEGRLYALPPAPASR